MTRFVPVTVLVVLAALASGRIAIADDTMPTGPLASGAQITFDELEIHANNSPNLSRPDDDVAKWQYFNLAHCQCTAPGATPDPDFREKTFAYLLKLTNANGLVSRPLEIWTGTNCDKDDGRVGPTATCRQVVTGSPPMPISIPVDSLVSPGDVRPEISIFDLMTPTPGRKECLPAQQNSTLWALVDTNMNNVPDYFAQVSLATDSAPPLPPTDLSIAGGDRSILIKWKLPSDASDVYGFQALCARADTGEPGKTTGRPPQRYITARTLCGLQSIDLEPDAAPGTGVPVDAGVIDAGTTDAGVPDAGTVDAGAESLPEGLQNLEPAFLCGEAYTPTSTSLRIDGLQNGVAYKVVLLELDKFENAWGTFFSTTVTPVESTDFWEDIHKDDHDIEGGLCLIAETYGDGSGLTHALRAFRDDTLSRSAAGRWLADAYYATLAKLGPYVHGTVVVRVVVAIVLAPVVALALLWHWLTLPGLFGAIAALWLWRRRRVSLVRMAARIASPRRVTLAGAMAIALAANHAHAGGYQPYWENSNIKADEEDLPPGDPGLVRWHAGVRIGPYLPDVDKAFSKNPGPFARNFSGARPMPMLDVDRILWTGFGQLGVGISIGYMQWFAHTFIEGNPDADPPVPPSRSPADTNTFRLIPMGLTAIYRFTKLDDDYGIPVIPYVRGGLSYYLWWISVNGSTASACKDPNAEMCELTKGLGASFGLQGSIGLAIRAERIDGPTAMSMQQSGIQHAGIYAELSLAKVDGFGSESKLSVGDATWFAGVNFEF